MIIRFIAINALRAVLRGDWKSAEMYYQLWQACRKPSPF